MKFVFYIILAFHIGKSNAEWVNIGSDTRGQVYIENKTIKRKNIEREFWLIINFSSPGKINENFFIKSEKALYNADCVGKNVGIIYHAEYDDFNAMGTRIREDQFKGGVILQGDIKLKVLEFVC